MNRRTPVPRPDAGDEDPTRLFHRGDDVADRGVADLMKAYARRTRPGDRGTVAAWYRLRPALDAAARDAIGAPARARARRWTGVRLLSGAVTAALVLLIAVRLIPSRVAGDRPRPSASARTEGNARGGVGLGGASGWAEPGAGGTEGSSGSRDLGETAAGDSRPSAPRRAG